MTSRLTDGCSKWRGVGMRVAGGQVAGMPAAKIQIGLVGYALE